MSDSPRSYADLRGYQRREIRRGLALSHFILGAGLGTGKTAMGLGIIAVGFASGDIERVLIVAPKNVALTQWHTEAANWAFANDLDFAICCGNLKQREAALAQHATVTVINVENLAWLLLRHEINTRADGTVVSDWPFDMLLLDESYLFSSASAKRFKRLRAYTRRVRLKRRGGVQPIVGTPIKRCVLMTGTPAPNGLQKLWSQMCLVDDGRRLGYTYTQFEATYYMMRPGASRYEKPMLRPGAADLIHERISDRLFVLRSDDYLELPEIVHTTLLVELPIRARKTYDTFKRDFVHVLSSGDELYAPSVAAMQNKLQQLCNGSVIHGDRSDPEFTGDWTVIHDAKLQALDDFRATTEDNLIVVYWYQSDLARLRERYPDAVVLSEGDVEDNLSAWNRGEIKLLLLHPASGGVGINAQHGGATMIWFGPIWDLYLWLQTLGRLHRSGQTRTVNVIVIACRDTVEQLVARGLQTKQVVQDNLLSYLGIANEYVSQDSDDVSARLTKLKHKDFSA